MPLDAGRHASSPSWQRVSFTLGKGWRDDDEVNLFC